ncbi:MAG TPA: glycosyl hydrolase family 18 protein [Polyangiaceae bacterium]|nr:glycosyl hydrolase family 18 protein [Polyangiaceae bacterium]
MDSSKQLTMSRIILTSFVSLCAAVTLAACSGSEDPPRTFGNAGSGGASTNIAGGGNGGVAPVVAGASPGGVMSGGAAPAGGQENGGAGASNLAGSSPGGSGGSGVGGSAGGSGGGTNTGTDGPPIKAVMYLPNWSGSFASWAGKLSFDKMTHLDLAFGTLKNGTSDWSLGAPDDDVKTIAAAAHAKGTKVMVSIGGADDDLPIIDRYADQANIQPMVDNLEAFIKRLDLDGVDVDLERGNGLKASTNFPKFLSTLIAKLRPQGKVVSCALAQYIIEDTGDNADTTAAWLNTYDFINLMIYNPNMSTYTKELDWWTTQRKIPKSKLTWGAELSNKTSTDYAKQLTTASKEYGGIMAWELSMPTATTLWPAIQSAL